GDWFKDKWVGLNMLGLDSNTALRTVPNTASGLWVDNACIGDDGVSIAGCNWKIRNEEKVDWPGLYFGGVAFKYQAPVKHLFAISKAATTCMDVITTSGIATGVPPDIEKIKTMRSAIGDFPLAVASGITPENVEPYRDLADCFLVATGISHSHTELDPKRVEMMVNAMNK
ncbi:MAG: Adenine phosphoribosyltransferase, partial [Candidatus Nomurabacteria bacterium GW2011_GWB1_37_5]